MRRIFLTDKEVAAAVETSEKSLYRMLAGFTPRGVRADNRINLNDAKPVCINGRRRWRVSAVASVLGVTVEELERRIS